MSNTIFVYIWEYIVIPEYRADFERLYGPKGEWVELFRKAEGYIATTLNEDTSNQNRFTTIDTWRSKEDHDRFLHEFYTEYKTLDKSCEMYTSQEKLIGYFSQHSH